ncbi:hypothetical protein VTO73DRAFT_12700 [Trametes versicolor]
MTLRYSFVYWSLADSGHRRASARPAHGRGSTHLRMIITDPAFEEPLGYGPRARDGVEAVAHAFAPQILLQRAGISTRRRAACGWDPVPH